MLPNHDRSTSFAERVSNAYSETKVNPKWIGDTNRFWYRREIQPGQFSFIFVNPEQRICRPAFDHERLAKQLKDRGIEASVDALPIDWIDPSSDGESTKFRIAEKKWQLRENETLTEYDGEVDEEALKPMEKETPSKPTSTTTVITFINRMEEAISLFWIDWDGDANFYEKVEAGQSKRRKTHIEHVWRVTRSESDEIIASYVAGQNESIAIIEKGITAATGAIEKLNGEKDSPQHYGKAFVSEDGDLVHESSDSQTVISTSGAEDTLLDKTIHRSPDGRFGVLHRYTPEQEHTVYQVESSSKDQVQPRLKQFQYLKPGDKSRVDRPIMIDFMLQREVDTDDSLFQNPFSIESMGWSDDGREYRFLYNQRGHQVLRVAGMSSQGEVRIIVEETSKTFVDYSGKLYYHEVMGTDELIWASERDGWNHLYLIDLKTGKVKNQITKGNCVVYSVDRIDEEQRQICFSAFGVIKGQDPYYTQLVRVNFDGSDLKILTEGDGTHDWQWSPNWKYFIDTWSRVDLAPATVLRDGRTGEHTIMLEKGNLEKLFEAGWTAPERFAAPGRDGETMIYGIIIRPSEFDDSQKYPVIEEIYAGPTDFSVPKAFSTLSRQHELAELGFIVVQIDGVGTNWRSKAFHNHCFKNLKDAGLPDRIAWMKAAAESRPWMDLSRVGIYGSSAGGQNALGALLWHGDFYKAAVADSGCHDNRMDKLWWNEQWMGWPVDQSYEDSSNVVHAGKLKGALMLIVGELDTNVDPASTMQAVNALNEAGKDYELLFMPGQGHGVGFSSEYAARRLRDFFVRHLMGVEPPSRNAG